MEPVLGEHPRRRPTYALARSNCRAPGGPGSAEPAKEEEQNENDQGTDRETTSSARQGRTRHVLRQRRGRCTPVQVARTFSPCSRRLNVRALERERRSRYVRRGSGCFFAGSLRLGPARSRNERDTRFLGWSPRSSTSVSTPGDHLRSGPGETASSSGRKLTYWISGRPASAKAAFKPRHTSWLEGDPPSAPRVVLRRRETDSASVTPCGPTRS